MRKKILVTGSEGYIGTVLANELIKRDYQVTGLDTNFFKDSHIKSGKRNYKLIKKDIRKLDGLDLHEYFAVIHLAALSNDITGDIQPVLTKDINFFSTVKLAKLAKKHGVKRFLFSSSCSIYGIAKNGTVNEKSPINPVTPYAKAKIASERDLRKLADSGFCVGLLRNSTVYGYSPNFRNDLVVNNLVTCALAINKLTIKSDGTPWRPLIDVWDLSNIFIAFLQAGKNQINSKVFNIGFNENNLQVRDIAHLIKKQLPSCEIVFTGEHGNDVRTYKVNFDKFHKAFPQIRKMWSLTKSIENMISKLRENNFNSEDYYSGRYTRLAVLNRLLSKKIIDKSFYWNHEN